MPLNPSYNFFFFSASIQDYQQDAITEILTLRARDKRAQLGSYGLTTPCRAFSTAVRENLNPALMNWAAASGVTIRDPDLRWCRPEAFQLARGDVLWPAQNSTVLLVPLNSQEVEITLRHRGSENHVLFLWPPNVVIHLTEMGLMYKGKTGIRFIYIMFRLGSA